MREYELESVERTSDKCRGADFMILKYYAWDGDTKITLTKEVRTPKIIRVSLTEIEINEL